MKIFCRIYTQRAGLCRHRRSIFTLTDHLHWREKFSLWHETRSAWRKDFRARERARIRQALMIDCCGLSGDMQYDWLLNDAQITWSREGRQFLTGRLAMTGSVSLAQQSWLWSWANASRDVVRRRRPC
ncbi:DUF6882 domain-containing protein [Streptomyces lavendulae]|uniref:DUF6882 domain-containing protein n=1 Tax=Streptomyces lavendulae TaxID=1914 RepID=UPI0033E1206F